MAERLLEVKDLKVQFATEDGTVRAVDGVSFELERGKVLGIVGESGSGKSVTAMTLLGLTRDVNARFEGEVLYKGRDLLEMSEDEMQHYPRQRARDDLPGPDDVAEPGLPDRRRRSSRRSGRTSDVDKGVGETARRRAAASRSGSRTRSRASTTSRTSSRAGCGSAR